MNSNLPVPTDDAERDETGAATAATVHSDVIDSGAAPELHDADDSDGETEADDRDEGDVAADFLEELLDIADIDGDLEIEVRGDRAYVSIEESDDDSNLKILADREVVEALQQLTRLAVQAETGEPSRLILDVAGSRQARQRELRGLVERAISSLEDGAASAALPPMSSYERKLVHDIAAELGYDSESEGEGAKRHTVIRSSNADDASRT